MTARSVGLKVAPINEAWLLAPENNYAEKEIARLNNENAQLKKAEPKFTINCVDYNGTTIDTIQIVTTIYEPMVTADIDEFLQALKIRYPIAANFDAQRSQPTVFEHFVGKGGYFDQATDEEISKYRDQEYPGWLRECRNFLSRIQETLQHQVTQAAFTIEAENHGTRPGNHALVVIRARGQFNICPPPFEEDDPNDEEQTDPRFPSPPRPPRGKWRAHPESIAGQIDRFTTGFGLTNYMSDRVKAGSISSLPMAPFALKPPERDPNRFYYKPTRPEEPTDSFELGV